MLHINDESSYNENHQCYGVYVSVHLYVMKVVDVSLHTGTH